MIDVKECKEELYFGKLGEELIDYYDNTEKISEAIWQTAHDNVDVYSDVLMEFIIKDPDQDDILYGYALTQLEYEDITEVDETFKDAFDSRNFDEYNRFSDINDFVNKYIEEHNLHPSIEEVTNAAEDLSAENNQACKDIDRDEEAR